MFRGKPRSIFRAEIEFSLGVDLNDTRLHELVNPGAEPPRHARVGTVPPPFARVSIYYR